MFLLVPHITPSFGGGGGEAFYLQLAIPRVVATAESTEIIMLMMNFQVSLCFMAYMVLKG